jgi:hypothetical protein
MQMLKILKQVGVLVIVAYLASCSDMNEDHDIYLKRGEIVYIGRVDSVRVLPGNGRFLLRYWVTDPRAKALKIYWSQKQDSLIVPIPDHAPLDSMDILVGDSEKMIPEGSYTVQLYTSDGVDLRSVLFEKNVNVYGEKFAATLLERLITQVSYDPENKEASIQWASVMSAKEVGIEITYFDVSGKEITWRQSTEEIGTTTVLKELDVTKGVFYRTMYLPEAAAIDTFFTASLKIAVKERANVSQGCQTSTSDFLSPYTGNFAVDGDNVTDPSRWVSDNSNNEHWLELDLGNEYLISAFDTWSGSPAQARFSLQVEVDGVWEDVHTANGNTNLHYYAEFSPVSTRKVRYYIPAYQTNRVRLYEIIIYSVKEY